jgi:glycosyltransferase involved in cell wall biosynthesis
LQIIINCGPCEQYIQACIASLRAQSYANWTAFVSVDPSGDSTFDCAADACRDEPRIHLTLNPERRFAMENLVRGIARGEAAPEDVIVVLDGDDWFRSNDSLQTIAATYRDTGCWMTYGSWVSNLAEMPGLWPAYPEGTTNFRQVRWLATAVRTWKKWLWDLVDDRDLRDNQDNYFRVTEDMATMFPMLEMSGTDRARHIGEPLMLYNNANPAGAARVRRDEVRRNSRLIRNRPPYSRLEAGNAGKG